MRHIVLQGRASAATIGLAGAHGEFLSAQQMGFPLMFTWHDSAYLGAIHGAAALAQNNLALSPFLHYKPLCSRSCKLHPALSLNPWVTSAALGGAGVVGLRVPVHALVINIHEPLLPCCI